MLTCRWKPGEDWERVQEQEQEQEEEEEEEGREEVRNLPPFPRRS